MDSWLNLCNYWANCNGDQILSRINCKIHNVLMRSLHGCHKVRNRIQNQCHQIPCFKLNHQLTQVADVFFPHRWLGLLDHSMLLLWYKTWLDMSRLSSKQDWLWKVIDWIQKMLNKQNRTLMCWIKILDSWRSSKNAISKCTHFV